MKFLEAKKYILARLKKELPPFLSYHSIAHTKDVYDAARRIAHEENIKGTDKKLLLTAALYHDCGFITGSHNHEIISCQIAKESLPQFEYSPIQIDIICNMILATKIPQSPKTHLEEILCDADLDYLGRDDFKTIGDKLFWELQTYGIITDEIEWNKLQVSFLQKHNYFTKTAKAMREEKKEKYLYDLKKTIQS